MLTAPVELGPDLRTPSGFVRDVLLPHNFVQHLKTSVMLETLKDDGIMPIDPAPPG